MLQGGTAGSEFHRLCGGLHCQLEDFVEFGFKLFDCRT